MPYFQDLKYCKESKLFVIDAACTDLQDFEPQFHDFKSEALQTSINLTESYLSLCVFSTHFLLFDPIVIEFSSNDRDYAQIISSNVTKSKSLYLVNSSHVLYGDINCKTKPFINKKKYSFQNINLIKKFNCFKKLNCKQKIAVIKRKGAEVLSYSERGLLLKNDSIMIKNSAHKKYRDEQVPMINEAQRNKMALPIMKESENLLFVASKISTKYLIGPPIGTDRNKKCCVIDLDETLVHSSFKELSSYDFKVDVNIEGVKYDIYIVKRPHVDQFLNKVGELFECVLFTASLSKYANLVVDILDTDGIFRWRLFREACVFYRGGFVKDLSMLGRPIDQIVILDNSPLSFLFHTKNAVHMISWFDDPSDRALLDIIPYCERLANYPSVTKFLQNEPPPTSAAWPIRSSFTYPLQIPASLRQPSSETGSPRANLNPITSSVQNNDKVAVDLAVSKKVSTTLSQNYSDRLNVQTIPAIRSFFGKNIVKRQSDNSEKTSYLSVLNSARQKRASSSDLLKPTLSKASISTSSSSTKEVSMRSPNRSSTNVAAFNTSINQRLNSSSVVPDNRDLSR